MAGLDYLESMIESFESERSPYVLNFQDMLRDPFERLASIRRVLPSRRFLNVRKRRTREQAKRRRIALANRKANVRRMIGAHP